MTGMVSYGREQRCPTCGAAIVWASQAQERG